MTSGARLALIALEPFHDAMWPYEDVLMVAVLGVTGLALVLGLLWMLGHG